MEYLDDFLKDGDGVPLKLISRYLFYALLESIISYLIGSCVVDVTRCPD